MPAALFHLQPSSGVPLWRQLCDQVRALRAGGRLKPGDLLPSVREVAAALAVNPMTVSKAWAQLERDGIVEHARGIGMRLTTGGAGQAARLAELDPLIDAAARRARQIGIDADTAGSRLADRIRHLEDSP
jgi:GntR family transcriptional regulator